MRRKGELKLIKGSIATPILDKCKAIIIITKDPASLYKSAHECDRSPNMNHSHKLVSTTTQTPAGILPGMLRGVHHIALNVQDMQASCHFYGTILGLHRLVGDEVPKTLVQLVAEGKVTNFKTPDGTILDLFWEPDMIPPDPDPEKGFTRAPTISPSTLHPSKWMRRSPSSTKPRSPSKAPSSAQLAKASTSKIPTDLPSKSAAIPTKINGSIDHSVSRRFKALRHPN